ncbi:MAG: LamG domain-containing protein, partial [Candidatus Binatus sp.]|uniref:LamG domain-containing protein n=1 Tax=Candidatus Binatus sp. TaxID=2811406 RepID=UPI00271A55BE
PLNQWSHVAGVFTGSVLQLYANGVLVGQVTLPAGKSRSSRIGVGRNAAGASYGGAGGFNFFSGLIDDVRITARALSPAEFGPINPLSQKPALPQ